MKSEILFVHECPVCKKEYVFNSPTGGCLCEALQTRILTSEDDLESESPRPLATKTISTIPKFKVQVAVEDVIMETFPSHYEKETTFFIRARSISEEDLVFQISPQLLERINSVIKRLAE